MNDIITLIGEAGMGTVLLGGVLWFTYEQWKLGKSNTERMYQELETNNQRIYKELEDNRTERKAFIKTLNNMNVRFESLEGKVDNVILKLDVEMKQLEQLERDN